MKYFITLLGGLLLVGCEKELTNQVQTKPLGSIDIFVVDNCQYIYIVGFPQGFQHKANCTNHVQKPVQLPPSAQPAWSYPPGYSWPNNWPTGYVTNLATQVTVTNRYMTNDVSWPLDWKLEETK